jgi:hypothetical protein
VQCTATITKIIYGSLVEEPRSSECGVVRGVASGLVRLAGPQHGLGRAPLGRAGCECGALAKDQLARVLAVPSHAARTWPDPVRQR